MDINNGAIRLSASDYAVTVADDYQREPEAVDLITVDFDSRWNPLSAPVLVNGEPWAGQTAFLKVELSWLPSTFTGADEPKLASDRPLEPNPGVFAAVGSAGGAPRLLSIDSISAVATLAGDYNRDGKLDANDYDEWQRAFGNRSEVFLYADGNSDSIVDAADYVVWRNTSALGTSSSTIPEPQGFATAASGFLWFALWSFNRRGFLHFGTSRRRSWKRVEPSL